MDARHGGNLRELAQKASRSQEDLLDFSANINPLGPPAWLRQEISRSLTQLVHYPDPDCRSLVDAACGRFGVQPEEVVCGNGSSELLFCLAGCLGDKRAIIPVPAYVDYAHAAHLAGMQVETLPLLEADRFAVNLKVLKDQLAPGSVVFLGQPNNPTGQLTNPHALRELAAGHPECYFVVDEAFADFVPDYQSLILNRIKNVIVLYSQTKFFAVPGLRLGLCFADPDLAAGMRARLPPWSVNGLAQAVGARALGDQDYAHKSIVELERLRTWLYEKLQAIQGLSVIPSKANFLLCKLEHPDWTAARMAERLLGDGMAVRVCDNFQGLTDRHFRVAVRRQEENQRLVDALVACLTPGTIRPASKRRSATLMFQGTGSNAGKSILTTALCRILLQDGVRVAPFKAQNMSLNSFVTLDGGEMGRAQVLQAQACRLEPELRMNPVLLKPNTDTGAQVIVMGKPVSNMNVGQYFRYKQEVWSRVQRAFDSLSEEFDAVVLEGAGSPGEVNLKHHDLVNMKMARHAQAPVLLVGDIDRGGVFASFIGHMEVMEEWERELVAGFVVNRFRGDATQLDPAFEYLEYFTKKPTFGVIPYLHDLGLPEEDSVTFKETLAGSPPSRSDAIHISVVLLPHISNFTDLDALRLEPDLGLEIVSAADQLGTPDCLILPGSKNVIGDLGWLIQTGLAKRIQALARAGATQIVGICGGFQMLGRTIRDPLGLESGGTDVQGLDLLPLNTLLEREKTLRRACARHLKSGEQVIGYEIHHGQTDPSELVPLFENSRGDCLGVGTDDHRIWGTYLHGVFDADRFRRWFVDQLRKRKNLAPLVTVQAVYDLEPALDRLAEVVRAQLPIEEIKRLMGM